MYSVQPSILRLEGLSFSYGDVSILKDIDFSIGEGESHAILGPSGCGKSTLLSLLAGFLHPTGGCISPEARRRPPISLVFQNCSLFPWKKVVDNIRLGYRWRSAGRVGVERHFEELVRDLDLARLLRRWPCQLSGGQKQRVALARALASESPLLMLDEPFSALDCFSRETLQDLLREMQLSRRFSTIFVTHDIAEAVAVAEHIHILGSSPGRIVHYVRGQAWKDRNFRVQEEYFRLQRNIRSQFAELNESRMESRGES